MAEKQQADEETLTNSEDQPSADDLREPDLGFGPDQNPTPPPLGPLDLDLGLGPAPQPNASSSSNPPTCDNPPPPRREEKPFSFKRFLNQDVRRKEYSPDGNPVLPATEHHSMLPDFVQDHLLVEQCYMSSPSSDSPRRDPLDLPEVDHRIVEGVSKSLPDFLSDGPIHSQRADDDLVISSAPVGPPLGRLPSSSSNLTSRSDYERLEREADHLRRLLHDRTRQNESLETELNLLRNRNVDSDNATLQIALNQMEDQIQLLTSKLQASESAMKKLKQENSRLWLELSSSPSTSRPSFRNQGQRLANDLRNAASSAEVHLRSLLTGIENLRLLADNLDGSTHHATDFNYENDEASGPAL